MNKVLIFLLFFFLPAGWAKHWIIKDSLVNGVLVDYLMPDLWLQDLLALAFIVLNRRYLKELKRDNLVIGAVLILLMTVPFSSVPLVSLVYLLRFLLAVTTGCLLIRIFRAEGGGKMKRSALAGLSGALVWTGALAVFQLLNQRTVFGWWFLGEPIFSLGSGGVKKIEIFNRVVVTPMATFPHTNVMAGFGLLTLLILLKGKRSRRRSWAIFFSLLLILTSLSFYTWVLRSGLTRSPSFWRRWQLIRISLNMIKDHFFFGVGWGGFAKSLPGYWQELGVRLRFLQPVHNLFLIMLSEVGFVGLLAIIILISRLYGSLLKRGNILFFALFFAIFLIDHYFWTTTQGVYTLFLLPPLLVSALGKEQSAQRSPSS